jgi:hypothetical protein
VRRPYSRPFWLIARYRTGGVEVLRTILASGREALPVFSFEDEARMFLELGTSGGWRVRETTTGELTSVLCGLCANVDRVVLDPVPLPSRLSEGLNELLSMEREAFMASLLNRQRFRSPTTGRGGVCSRAGVTVRTATPVRR